MSSLASIKWPHAACTQIASVSQTPTRWRPVPKAFEVKRAVCKGGTGALKPVDLLPHGEGNSCHQNLQLVLSPVVLFDLATGSRPYRSRECGGSSAIPHHFNQLTRRCQLALHLTGTEILSVKKESCGDGRVATQQVLDGAGSCRYGPARRRLRILVTPTETEAVRSSAAP